MSQRAPLIYVADDDEPTLELIATFLGRDGLEVVGFSSADRLIAAIPARRPDAVLLDGDRVLAKTKRSTTPDVSTGIQSALADHAEAGDSTHVEVNAVMIGTTHFTNAFIEGRQLNSVAVVRLCLPATQGVPPLTDWPASARYRVSTRTFLCHGGHEYDGRRISPVDPKELLRVAGEIDRQGLESIALAGVFSTVNPEDELHAAAVE